MSNVASLRRNRLRHLPRLLGASAIVGSLLILPIALAAPRTSTHYTLSSETANAGGNRATSSAYTHDGNVGDTVAGFSTDTAPATIAKHGYLGQLTEGTALQLAAAPTTVDETATRQLTAVHVLDDATANAIPATSITWSVQSGPLLSINPSGLATTATVYQDTLAVAQGSFAGLTGSLNLAVVNTIADNFGAYAADGLDDDWQVTYFGLNNPDAAPLLDPDSDGHNNRFEFVAGLVPTDALSVFRWRIERVPGQPSSTQLIFSPVVGGRSYVVKFRPGLTTGSWLPLTGTTETDNGNERTVTDPNVTGPTKFYQVEIVKP